MKEASPQKIAGDELCELTGLTDRRHRQLAKDGFFPPPLRGQYQLMPTLRGLFKFYREVRAKDTGSLAVERLRKLKEEADKVALENEKTRGGLVEIEAVYKHFEAVFVAFRARILASDLGDQEKDELLNDLRRLKARDFSKSNGAGSDSGKAGVDPKAAAAV